MGACVRLRHPQKGGIRPLSLTASGTSVFSLWLATWRDPVGWRGAAHPWVENGIPCAPADRVRRSLDLHWLHSLRSFEALGMLVASE